MMPKHLTRLLILVCLITAIASGQTLAESIHLHEARHSYSHQDWATALEKFLIAADQANDEAARVSAQFYAAECALQLKNFTRARKLYHQVLESDKAAAFDAQATFRLAESLHLSGDLSAALVGYQRFAESFPRDELAFESRNCIGEILVETRRLEDALDAFSYVVEHSHGAQNDRGRLGMARVLVALKRYEEVPITLGRLCQSNDSCTAAEALCLLGRARYEAGQLESALATFRRVYQLNCDNEAAGRARLAAGWVLWKLLRLEDVAAEVDMLAGNASFAGEYYYLLGMTAHSAKEWSAADEHLQRALDAGVENRGAALFYAGESALRGGNPKSAKAIFQKLLETELHSEWADDAAWGLTKVARAVKSEADFDAACKLLRTEFPGSGYVSQIPPAAPGPANPLRQSDPDTDLFEEAAGLERDGRFDGAIAAYNDFLARAATSNLRAEALWRAARLQERLKQFAEARRLYAQMLSEFPDSDHAPEALGRLAKIGAESGNVAVSAKICRELLEKFPQTTQAVEASYWLAVAAADEKKADDAQWQIDWLLDRLGQASGSLSDVERCILGQTLCLQCQLFSVSGKWHKIAELLDGRPQREIDAATNARLDFWRAEAALRLGAHADARQRFNDLAGRTVGINESWVPMVPLRQAQLAARREVWQDVLKLVDELDERYPEFELAYECDYLRGRALAGRGEMSAARTAYEHVLANDWAAGTETAAMAQWMIGESYFHQRNYELARVAYERVIERHHFPEWQARAALQAGKCAELDDNWEAATKYYADATERWHDTKSGRELSARLHWVQERVAQEQAMLRR